MQATGGAYPVDFTFDAPEKVANWRPLVQWILAIPHLLVLSALRTISQILSLVSWFVIVITGELPDAFANFQAMYLRYYVRVGSYSGFLREEYPPFGFDMATQDPGDDPRIRVRVDAELHDRNRLTTAFRFVLVIPQLVAVFVLSIAASIAFFIAFFAVLFTGRWPEGLRAFVVDVSRYWLRVDAYSLLVTDEYPPFALH